MITILPNKFYEERLMRINLFSLEKRRLRGKLTRCVITLKSFTNVDASILFSNYNSPRKRSNGVKLKCKQMQLDSSKFFFTNDVVMECDTINSLKNKLNHHFLNQGIR